MEEIKNLFREKRPNLSNSTLSTYYSLISSLHNKLYGTKIINLDNFKNAQNIIDYLQTSQINTRRTILSALYVLTDNILYRDEMMKDIMEIKSQTDKQIKNDKQKENSISQETLKNVYESLKKKATILYKTNNDDYIIDIQDFIIVSLYYLIPPRRLLDYTEFKIKNIDKETDNYMDKNTFVFNRYKTQKTYGKQIVKIPENLKKIIKQWIKINPTEYLLFDKKHNKLIGQTIKYRFNKIFGEGISVNALRHSYLSDKYLDTIKVNAELEHDMTQMGSSISQQKTYIQNTD